MRIPYVPNPFQTRNAEEAAIVSRIEARRSPRPLQPLDLALLHAPAIADGWNSFIGAVRTQTTLAADLRELAISRIAVVNQAWYEWMHHAPLAVAAGVPEAALELIKVSTPLNRDDLLGAFSEKQAAILLLTDEMTRTVQVSDATFDAVKKVASDTEVVEIVATISCYNCVSRFLVALDDTLHELRLLEGLVGERNGVRPA